MPSIVVTGDLAGGAIQNTLAVATTLNGAPIAVEGDLVARHPPCPTISSHCAATMTASSGVTINGARVVVNMDQATCTHPAIASNASTIDPS